MKNLRSLKDELKEVKYKQAKYELILSKFPDAKAFEVNQNREWKTQFKSKSVNKIYNNYYFENKYSDLDLYPLYEMEFEFMGKSEIIQISSIPSKLNIIKLSYRREAGDYINIIKFSTFFKRYKANKFSDKFLNDCRIKILEYIKNNPKYELDTKNIDPRVKKLLIFS